MGQRPMGEYFAPVSGKSLQDDVVLPQLAPEQINDISTGVDPLFLRQLEALLFFRGVDDHRSRTAVSRQQRSQRLKDGFGLLQMMKAQIQFVGGGSGSGPTFQRRDLG